MLVVTDVEAAVAFYRDAFGMEFALTPLRTATCERGSTVYGLYEGDGKFEGGRSVAVIVDNLDETHEKAVAAGRRRETRAEGQGGEAHRRIRRPRWQRRAAPRSSELTREDLGAPFHRRRFCA